MKNIDYKAMGNRIRARRLEMGLTQEKLAEMADCSLSYIGFVERGEMSLSLYNFLKIASALKLDLSTFLQEFI